MKKILLQIMMLAFSKNTFADCGNRYLDSLFSITTYSDILYGGNYDSKNQWTPLLMDVYEPQELVTQLRPMIIFVHGGSFTGGDRLDQRMDLKAQYFTQRGYVTANIEYRVEQTEIISPYVNFAFKDNWYQAMIRASQDLKAAIRYFKKDVAENGNTYQIDTTNIIIYGSSAGAITMLNTVFIDDTAEMSNDFKKNYALLDGFEGNSGSAGYSSKGIKAVVSCSGAVDNLDYFNNNLNIPYIAFHNTIDLTVPYSIGCFITVACHLNTFFGDQKIFNRLQQLDTKSEFYPINYANHPVDEYEKTTTLNFIYEKTRLFLYDVVCNGKITSVQQPKQITALKIFPNPNNGQFTVELPNSTNTIEGKISITNAVGQEIYNMPISTNQKINIKNNFDNGLYFVQIKSKYDDNIYLGKINIIK